MGCSAAGTQQVSTCDPHGYLEQQPLAFAQFCTPSLTVLHCCGCRQVAVNDACVAPIPAIAHPCSAGLRPRRSSARRQVPVRWIHLLPMASKHHSTLQTVQRVSRAAARCWSIMERRSTCAREHQRLGCLSSLNIRTDAEGQHSSQRGLRYALYRQVQLMHSHDLRQMRCHHSTRGD